MSAVADMDAELAAAVTDPVTGFGEPVMLPGGAVVHGVFSAPGVSSEIDVLGTDMGGLQLGQQAQPMLRLRTVDAGGLAEGDRVDVRGTSYAIVALTPDSGGMTAVALYEPSAQDVAAQNRVWR